MRKQDHLQHLIKSMNSNEKRYFKLFSELQPGNKRYAQLFEILEQEEQYDVTKLCADLKLTPKQLTGDKYYLQLILLRCLRNFEDEASDTPAERLVEIMMADVKLLLNRRLFYHALDLIEKAKQRALELEMFETALSLLSAERISLINIERFEQMEASYKEYERISKIQAEAVAIGKIRMIVTSMERKMVEVEKFGKILQEPLLQKKPDQLLSLKAQAAWFDIVVKCYLVGKLDKNKSLEIARLQVKHYEKNSALKRLHPLAWLTSYSFLASAEMALGNIQNALQSLTELERLLYERANVLSKATVLGLKGHVHVFKTALLFKLNEFDATITQAENAASFIKQRPVYEQFFVLFYHALALLHLKRTDEALEKLNMILDLNAEERMDLQVNVRPIIIMCHLDLGNYQMVPYLIKSGKAWMKRKKITSPQVMAFFSFTYAISKTPFEEKRRTAWLKLQEATGNGKLAEIDKEVNLSPWLEGKIAARR